MIYHARVKGRISLVSIMVHQHSFTDVLEPKTQDRVT